MEAKRDASLAEADLVVSKSVIGLTTADRMSSVVDFLRNHVARPGRNSPPRRVRPSGVLATGWHAQCTRTCTIALERVLHVLSAFAMGILAIFCCSSRPREAPGLGPSGE